MSIIDLISDDLRIPPRSILDAAAHPENHYRTFSLHGRPIEAPDNELKLIQTWICDFIRSITDEPPSYVTAYERERSIFVNARMHSSCRHILTLDIKHFFHSWDEGRITSFFLDVLTEFGHQARLVDYDACLLSALSTYRGHLTMGSPCSPCIANRLMLPIDRGIIESLPSDYVYTRYSDDICISAEHWIDADIIVKSVNNCLQSAGLELNKAKTRCRGMGDPRRITGIFLAPDGKLSIGSKRRKHLTSDVYRYVINDEGRIAINPRRLYGQILFCKQVEPGFAARLITKYSNYGRAVAHPGGLMGLLKDEMS